MLKNINPKSKHQPKKQKSQQIKPIRHQKNSPSPIYKQININKQNIHPNHYQPIYPHSNNNNSYCIVKNQDTTNNIPLSSDNTKQCRQIYYRLKQQTLNSKLYNIKNQSVQQPIIGRPGIYNIHNLPRQIEIKINSHSLQKCQVHPTIKTKQKQKKKALCTPQYLIPKQDYGDIICCQDCAGQFKNKIPIDKIANTYISPGISIQNYYNILQQKIDCIETMKFNMELYVKQFREMSTKQLQKHRKYYNNILEIIEISMKQSQNVLAKYINQGQMILLQKKQELDNQLNNVKEELKKLLNFQDKQIKFPLSPYHKDIKFKIDQMIEKYQSEINLPVISLYTQMDDIQEEFKKIFNTKFSLVLLTKQQLEEKQKQMEKEKEKETALQSVEQSYKKTTSRYGVQDDLFCDQQLGQSKTNKTHDFSFEKSNQDSLIGARSNDCILELVQEEDVISPVFKAI